GGNQARRPRGSSHTSIVTGFTTINGVRHVEVIGGNEGPDPPRQSGSVRVRRFALNASGGIENPAAHRMFGIIKITGC
ncbi:MAG: hypothetical protein ACK2UK_11615, partial [Candidatus Promineifilaceae bacterium]